MQVLEFCRREVKASGITTPKGARRTIRSENSQALKPFLQDLADGRRSILAKLGGQKLQVRIKEFEALVDGHRMILAGPHQLSFSVFV